MKDISKLKGLICDLIKDSGIPKSQINNLFDELKDFLSCVDESYCKNYDEPVLTNNLKVLANKIVEINPNVKYIPIGYYSTYSYIHYFICDFESVYDMLSDKMVGIPTFDDDMTKRQWNDTLKYWKDIITESDVHFGSRDSDYCKYEHIIPFVYNIETTKFEELAKLY